MGWVKIENNGTAAIAVPVSGGSVTIKAGESKTCEPRKGWLEGKETVLLGLSVKFTAAKGHKPAETSESKEDDTDQKSK